jgi:hypothetical protein
LPVLLARMSCTALADSGLARTAAAGAGAAWAMALLGAHEMVRPGVCIGSLDAHEG